MAVFLVERGVIGAQVETTKGTANAPTAVNAGIEIKDVSLVTDIQVMERDPIRASFDDEKNITGNRMSRLTFKSPLRGTGSAGTRPEHTLLMRGSSLSEAIVAATSVTYNPVTASASQETLTLDVYLDGILHRLTGAAGTFRMTVRENEVPELEWEFHGVYTAPSDTTLLAGVAYDATSPPSPLSATLTFRSQTLAATGWTFDLGNEIQPRQDITRAAGLLHFNVVNRKPVITVDPEIETIATFDFWTNLVNASAGAFVGQFGLSGGNRFRLLCPNTQLVEAAPAERNGLRILNCTLKPRRLASAGDDSHSLRWD